MLRAAQACALTALPVLFEFAVRVAIKMSWSVSAAQIYFRMLAFKMQK